MAQADIKGTVTAEKQFGAPIIPETPSKIINDTLKRRFGKPTTKLPVFLIGTFVCRVFNLINALYRMLNPDKSKHSHRMWMAACGVVAAGVAFALLLLYNVIVASAFLVHGVLFYGFILIGLFSVGLAVSGMMFFDKDAAEGQKYY